MIDFENKPNYDISDLAELMRILRSPEGCPWDREQTHKSIRRNMLEEAYEAAAAIDEENTENLLEELGDILLQVLFHAEIAKDSGTFTLEDIIDATCKKLLRRHPHVFSNAAAEDGKAALSVWEDAKREEKHHSTIAESMQSVAHALPALWRAEKIQKKAAKAGFDWPDYKGALEALRSEFSEIACSIEESDGAAIKEELGDLLFSAVNLARFFKIDPEEALNESTEKFISRFKYVEDAAAGQNRPLTDTSDAGKLTLDELEALYQEAKKLL